MQSKTALMPDKKSVLLDILPFIFLPIFLYLKPTWPLQQRGKSQQLREPLPFCPKLTLDL
ncbi:hypothetical protein PCE01_07070 [Pediococcus cellicola]|nr:hypothetical protein PCE01_07070 [Pediococcus cellicola]